MSTQNIPTDRLFYSWTRLRSSKEYIRIHDIRFMAVYNTGTHLKFISAIPVLVRDGKSPDIRLCCSHVYRIKSKSGGFKYFCGRPTEAEEDHAVEVPMLYSGDPSDSGVFKPIADVLSSYDGQLGSFHEPMWCRYAKSRRDLYPIDNMVVRDDLELDRDVEIPKADLKKRWDNMAEPVGTCGSVSSGMLWEYGVIRFGGVMCVPLEQFDSYHKDRVCAITMDDFKHVQKTRKWKLI